MTSDSHAEVHGAGHTFQDELREAKVHAKHAARATLLAMRSAVDFAISKLDDDGSEKATAAGDSQVEPVSPN